VEQAALQQVLDPGFYKRDEARIGAQAFRDGGMEGQASSLRQSMIVHDVEIRVP
jgi:hypothetical protein